MSFSKVAKFFMLSSLFVAATSASAQDKLAMQAPVDHKSKAVEQMTLKNLANKENIENPSSDLYEEWENKRTHAVYAMPEQYKIDLRGFHMPTNSRVITSNYGRRWGRMHKGLDIKVYIGDTIRAAFSGKVRIVRYEANGYGNYVVIRHNNGLETVYGHMSKHLVKENQTVRAGQPIGLGGNTGRSTGSHLHFETRLCGTALNPALMFDFRNQDVTGDYYTYRRSTHDSESLQATRLRGKNDNKGYSKADVQGNKGASSANNNAANNKSYEPVASKNSDYHWHTVQAGESIESIAQAHNMTPEQLCRMNNIGLFTALRKGQHLRYQ